MLKFRRRGLHEGGPGGDHRVGRRGRNVERTRTTRRDDRDARTQIRELGRTDPVGPIDEDDVSSPDRTERLQGPRDLALDVEDACELLGMLGAKIEWKISHVGRVYGGRS